MEELIIIAICLLVNSILAAYEMAFVSVPKVELRRLSRSGSKEAQRLLGLRENPERTLSIIQVGITLVGAVSAAVGGAGAADNVEPYFVNHFGFSDTAAELTSVILVVLPLTYLSVVMGELVPKTLALRNPLKITLFGSRPLFVADRILSPVVDILEWSTKIIISKVFPRASKKAIASSDSPVEIDSLSLPHQQYVINLVQIERKRIKDILVPWNKVNLVSKSSPQDEIVTTVFSSGHTRLPVMDGDHVAGVLHTKEFLAYRDSGESNWTSIVRPILKVNDTDTALNVLRLMQMNRSHIAIVYSLNLEKLGIVTLEDINEEIWGEIYDEDDDGRLKKILASKGRARTFSTED